MNNDNGMQYFGLALDNSKLASDAAESRAILSGIGDRAVSEGQRIDQAFNRIGKAIAGAFTVQKAAEFARQIVSVRAEIESLEISFQTLLGSKAKADQLFGEIRQFAVQTPMQLNDLAKGAQMLLSFNVEADKVMGILRAIGDVSMGDAQKFNSLTLAFSQMSSTGKLMGQDLLQMINAGFNPLSVISEKTGKSIAVLKDEMSAGKITADMITQAFMDATSEGGKFFNMLEKQSHGINGALSNIQGAWNDMLNDLGQSSQEFVTGTVEGLTKVVKNYHEVGKAIEEIVIAYGSYKAVLLTIEAVQRSYMAVKHADEASQLYALLPAEKQAKISKLELVATSEEYYIAVKKEVAAEIERQAALAASAKTDLEAAQQRLTTVTQEEEVAAAKVAARQESLAAALEEAQAETVAALQVKKAKESEAQSIAALRVAKLEERKQALINQAATLKEQGASAEVIAAKNREIAAVSKKIAAARAEEQQHGRNVIAIRKEIAASAENATSKKVEAERIALVKAQEELSAASKARETAATNLSTAASKQATVAKTAEAIATGADTAAETADATATGFLTIAKDKLEAAAARLNAVLMANPYALVTAAVVALGYAIYKLTTYQTDAQKAAKRLKEATDECERSVLSEGKQIDILFGRLKAAKEGTEEYEKAKKAIINQYGEYLKGLSNEIQSLKDVEGAYKAVTAAAREAAQARAMETYTKKESDVWAEKIGGVRSEVEKMLTKKFGTKKGEEYFMKFVPVLEGKEKMTKELQDIMKQFTETHYVQTSSFGTSTTYEVNILQEQINKAAKANAVLQKAMGDAKKKFGEAPATKPEDDNKGKTPEVVKNKKYYEDLVKGLTQQYENLTVAKRQSEEGRKLYQQIVENQKIIDGYSVSKSTSSEDRSKKEAADIARETAERNKRIEAYADSVKVAKRQAELDIEQAAINGMEDGLAKELRQIQLNYDRLTFENEKRQAEMLEKLRDAKQLEWENSSPKAKKEGKTFDRSTITLADLSEEQKSMIAEYSRVAEEIRQKANKDSLDKMLSDVLTYEQQRTKIAEEYERRRKSLYETDDKGNYKVDGEGNKIMRQGVSKDNLEELNRQENEALKAIDEQFAQREESYKAWCDAIADLTLKQLESVLNKAEEELEALRKSGKATDQQIATAKAKVTKAKEAVAKKKEQDNLNPSKRTIKEWEDLYKTLGECAKEFENIGDAVGGTAGEIIKSTGQIMTSTLSMINGIVQLVQTSSSAMVGAATAGVTALQVVEKASVILTVISAAMSIAMAIINLFNSDSSKQEEIEELQSRIDQLQWELDNAEAVRIQERYGNAVENVRKVYEDTLKIVLQIHAEEFKHAMWYERYALMKLAKEEATAKSVKKIADYYAQMAYTADKALGEDRFNNAREQLENIAEQQLLIQQQIDLENSKKHDDQDKIAEWKRKIQELGEEAVTLINDMVDEIIGGSSNDIANDLAEAFFEAFEAGEDAAEAWGKKVNEIVGDIMKRMLVQKFLETRLGEVFDKYRDKWFVNGQFQGLDAVTQSMSGFATDLKSVGNEFAAIWENLPEDVKSLFNLTGDAAREASEKGIAQASQESVDELNGRMTAVQGHTYSICENTKLLLSTANLILQSVMNIETNTDGLSDRMKNVEDDVHEVKETINDIALKGIKIK